MKTLDIEVEASKDFPEIGILHIKGEMVSEDMGKISAAFEVVQKGKFIYVIADMQEATLISSPALGELMGCRTQLVQQGGDLVLAGLSLKLRERLTAMDANKIFKFYPDVRSAMNAFRWDYRGHSENLTLNFPSQMHFVPPVRQLVSRIAKQKGFSNRDSFRIETIVDEICNNAVEHGVQDRKSCVDLSVTINPKKIEIKVNNTSDPEKAKSLKEISKTLAAPKPVDAQMRGRGLALVKMLANDFAIECCDAGTSVHVTKIREE
jgi:anti-sigma regulatory factor (Ser/Thr protein kinase)/anti-anti-sigma regulatory factor